MEDKVYLLWFIRERAAGQDTELLIGIYRTQEDAMAAIERLKGKPGFVNYPQGFEIHDRVLGEDSWTEDFVEVPD